ncbi:MAG: ABC transporter permease [Ancalomicrobiaceae bacterium]|nr:ABC transporter permease [Ancalomicrobiaceae bacterium]
MSPRLMHAGRVLAAILMPLGLWWAIVIVARPEPFILPGPDRVVLAFIRRWPELLSHGATTALEIVLGLIAGCVVGAGLALLMALSPRFGRLATPVIVASQSLPTFAIAPVLVLWFGFGLMSKVVMATIVIFFPVASAFHDGLTRTDAGLLDLANLYGADGWQRLTVIRVPAALPGLVSGLRMAATVAPIGAIIGEWVGASSGLGLVMMQANARLQTDFMFAALAVVVALAVAIRLLVDALTRHLVPWAPETAR